MELGELLEGDEAGAGAGKREVVGRGWRGGFGEGDQPAEGGDSPAGGCEGDLHVVYRAEGDGGEGLAGGHVLYAAGPDGRVGQVEAADGLAEEACLLALGLGERDVQVWEQELDGQAGEAGSGAEVEKTGRREEGRGKRKVRSELEGAEEALAEVALDDALGVADGGEVGAGVPAEEEVEVGGELREERCGGWGIAQVGGEEGGDAGFGERGHREGKL